jgi:UDP-N-acetylmuramyl pentapeptide synthase
MLRHEIIFAIAEVYLALHQRRTPRPIGYGEIPMKNMMLAALAALTLGAAVAPAANAFTAGFPQTTRHSGPYDNTGNGPGNTWLNGGGNG